MKGIELPPLTEDFTAIAGVVFVGASLDGLNMLTLVVVVMFAVLVVEHRRIQRLQLHAELET